MRRFPPAIVVSAAALVVAVGAAAVGARYAVANRTDVLRPAEPTMPLVGQVGGRTSGIDVAGDVAAVAVGPRLVMLEVTDDAAPRRFGASPVLSRTLESVLWHGRHAYASGIGGGLWTLDVSDPTAPAPIGYLDAAHTIYSMAAFPDDARYLAAVDAAGSLVVLDLSEPRALREVASVAMGGDGASSAIAMADGRAYWAYGRGATSGSLTVLDMSRPTDPRVEGQAILAGRARAVAIKGGHALVGTDKTLTVFDVADPSDPRPVAVLDQDDWPDRFFGPLGAMAIAGDWAFVIGGLPGGERSDDVPVQGGVLSVYVRDPAAPRVMGFWSTGTTPPHRLENTNGLLGLAVGRKQVLATEDEGRVYALAVADPRAPELLGTFDAGVVPDAIASDGVVLYASDGWGVQSLALDEPTQPEPRRYNADFSGSPYVVGAGDKKVYCGTSGTFSFGFEILDAGSLDRQGVWPGLFVADAEVRAGQALVVGRETDFVGDPGWSVLHVLDVSGAAAPTKVGTLALGSPGGFAPTGIALAGDLAVVSGSPGPLLVVDVSEPSAPRRIGRVEGDPAGWWRATDVAVVGRYALALDGDRLRVVDLGRPSWPLLVHSFRLSASPYRLVVDDAVVGYAVDSRLIETFDLSQLPDVRSLGTWEAPVANARLGGVAVAGRQAYIGAGSAGILVIPRVDPSLLATPTSTAVATGTPADSPRPGRLYVPAALFGSWTD